MPAAAQAEPTRAAPSECAHGATAARRALDWFAALRPWRAVLALALLTRVLWLSLALVGVPHQIEPGRFAHRDAAGRGFEHTAWQSVDMWTRWDGVFYLRIAAQGYGEALAELRPAFFPLYPLVCRAVAAALPLPLLPAALLLAHLCDVLGWALVYALARLRLPQPQAACALLCFAVFPTRNFGFSIYSEGLYVCLSAAAFVLHARHRRWAAALVCALLSACRPQGVLVGMALAADAAWAVLCQAGAPRRLQRLGAALLPFALAPAGLVAYMIFLQYRFAAPLAFVQLQSVWRRQLSWPTTTLLASGEPLNHLVLWGSLLLWLQMLRKRAPLADTVYVGLSLALPLCTGSVTSLPRFVGMLFPLFIFAAQALPRRSAALRGYAVVALLFSVQMAIKVGMGARVI